MSDIAKRSGPTALGTTAATIYTCPTGKTAVVAKAILTNITTTSKKVTLSVGVDAVGTRVLREVAIAPNGVEIFSLGAPLIEAEVVQAFADAAASVNVLLAVIESDPSASGGGGVSAFTALSDVSWAGAAAGDVPVWNGTALEPDPMATASTVNPLPDGTATPGTALPYAREDHVHPASGGSAPGNLIRVPHGTLVTGFRFQASGRPENGTFGPDNGRFMLYPVYFDRAKTLVQIGVKVVTAGSAGAVVRPVIYNSNADGMPGTLLVDGGQLAATTTGDKVATISQVIAANTIYWIGVGNQGAPTTLPIWQMFPENAGVTVPFPDNGVDDMGNAYRYTGITGAPPSLASTAPAAIERQMPRVFFEV